jgi:hypothetical protein
MIDPSRPRPKILARRSPILANSKRPKWSAITARGTRLMDAEPIQDFPRTKSTTQPPRTWGIWLRLWFRIS